MLSIDLISLVPLCMTAMLILKGSFPCNSDTPLPCPLPSLRSLWLLWEDSGRGGVPRSGLILAQLAIGPPPQLDDNSSIPSLPSWLSCGWKSWGWCCEVTHTLTAVSGCGKCSGVGELVTALGSLFSSSWVWQNIRYSHQSNNNSTHHLQSTYRGPSSVLRTLHVLIHFSLAIPLWYYCYLYFACE